MKMREKVAPIAGYISIVLGVIGIVTGVYVIGGFIGVVGLLFAFSGYGYINIKLTYAGVFLNNLAILWFGILCIAADSVLIK